jgi:hypothetical protein
VQIVRTPNVALKASPAIGGLVLFLAVAFAVAQDQKQAIQQRIAQVKQSMAENQARLRQYKWTESTEISVKGDVKKMEQKECRYGPDGKIVKTDASADTGEGKRKRGLRGKIVANKIEDMKEYMDRVGSLVHRYVPPDPQAMQTAFQGGRGSANAETGELIFVDYAKPGDRVAFAIDPAAKALRGFNVDTYLDSPEDKVTLTARFGSLADGTKFLEETLLNAQAKKIQIKTVNFDHQK